jgi:hypothetical protein
LEVFSIAACNDSFFAAESKKKAAVKEEVKEFIASAIVEANIEGIQGVRGLDAKSAFVPVGSKLDLLVVIDNSPSMKAEQINLASKLNPLLAQVKESDWQIKIITTDGRDSCSDIVIRKSDADAAARFSNIVLAAGVEGSGNEQGINQAVKGLQCTSAPWLRDGSSVAVLIVSDEDNCSDGTKCLDPALNPDTLLRNHLTQIREFGKNARVYGIVMGPGVENCDPNNNHYANVYTKLITDSGGKWGSICDADYTTTLSSISSDVARILTKEVPLDHIPDKDSVQITIGGQPFTDFSVVDQRIIFNSAPPAGTEFLINYRYGSEGNFVEEFAVSEKIAIDSLQVLVDGQPAAADSYTYDKERNRLIFKSPWATGTKYQIIYHDVDATQDTFGIGTSAVKESIAVTYDDKPAQNIQIDYDETTGNVKITPAPPEKTKVKIKYRLK